MNTMSFNIKIYGETIKEWIPDISHDDLVFVANKSANLYRSIDDGCIDNYRVSRIIDGNHSAKYEEAIESGCCGSTDKTVVNTKTGNSFTIGFNYGH